MKSLLIGATLITVCACSDVTAPIRPALRGPSNAVDVNQAVPSALVTANPCNDDVVALTGTLHILVHSGTSASGVQHFYYDVTGQYKGVGVPSGLKYQGATTRQLDDFNAGDFLNGDGFPIVESVFVELRLQNQTGADNYYVLLHVKTTVNNNGVPTASVNSVAERCRG